jgi:hypothetical protein
MGLRRVIPLRQLLVLLAVSLSLRLFAGCATEAARGPASASKEAQKVLSDYLLCAPTSATAQSQVLECIEPYLPRDISGARKIRFMSALYSAHQISRPHECPEAGPIPPGAVEVCVDVSGRDGETTEGRFLLMRDESGDFKIVAIP